MFFRVCLKHARETETIEGEVERVMSGVWDCQRGHVLVAWQVYLAKGLRVPALPTMTRLTSLQRRQHFKCLEEVTSATSLKHLLAYWKRIEVEQDAAYSRQVSTTLPPTYNHFKASSSMSSSPRPRLCKPQVKIAWRGRSCM